MTTRRYIALLRGINVGRAKRIAMADLRQLIGKLGYTDVRTLLNSGNVVFSGAVAAPALACTAIDEALVLRLGVAARVQVLDCAELDAIIAANPLTSIATDPARLLAFVVADPASLDALQPLVAQRWEPEALALGERAAYLWCPKGVPLSKVAPAAARLLGDEVSARNWTTLLKLQKMCIDPGLQPR
jgi:uncharacterized protein (DUF1697 family)